MSAGRTATGGGRRVLVLATLAALAVAGLALTLGASRSGAADGTPSTYRVNAIFDTAKGIIPGQVVKIAGARVGSVDDVTLTEDFKARIEMTVDGRFAPFRSDAACDIQPEGLISERFVQCDPGSPDGRELQQENGVPTVPVERTKVPVAITDLFNIFNLPVRQRFTVIVSSLGLGLAGRGTDVNEIIRRASPTLGLVRDVLQRLERDKRDLQDAVSATDAVVAQLAQRPERVGDFVDRAARLTSRTARHTSALRQGIRDLPALLDETEPTVRRFETFSRASTPLLRQLRTAAPQLTRLLTQVKPFAEAGRPALRSLNTTSMTGRRTIEVAAPVVDLLRTFAGAALPTGTQLADLVTNLRDRGVTESVGRFAYNAVGFTGRYDKHGHIAPAHAFFNACAIFAETPSPDCRATYTTPTPTVRRQASRPAGRAPADTPARKQSRPLPVPARPAPKPTAPKRPEIRLPGLPTLTLPEIPGLDVKGLGRALDGRSDDAASQGLLEYLLG